MIRKIMKNNQYKYYVIIKITNEMANKKGDILWDQMTNHMDL